MISKSLIQFSVDGWGCVPSLLFDLRLNFGEGNENNGDLLQKVLCTHCHTQYPGPCSRPPLTHASAGDSLLLGPGMHKLLFVTSKSLFPQSCVSSGGSVVGLMATSSKKAYATPRSAALRASAPAVGNC